MVAAQRRIAAGRAHELFDDLSMQKKCDAGYRDTIAKLTAQGERIEILDGEAAPDTVFQDIKRVLAEVLC